MIDPRITAPTTLPAVQLNGTPRTSTPPQNQANSQANTPNGQPPSPKEGPKPNGSTPATSIPNISHLIHATDSVSVVADNKNNSRAGSKSPKGEQKPKDIPHEKLNIVGEDQRAIRVLDRKFCI
jgi:hypothetical protein